MHFKYLLLLMITSLTLSGCIQPISADLLENPSPNQNRDSASHDLKLSVTEASYDRPVDNIKYTIDNSSESLLEYGEFFYLEKKVNGEWYMLAFEDKIFSDFYSFTNFGHFIKPEGERVHSIDPGKYNLTIDSGEYRLSKAFRYEEEDSRFWLADEFTVE